MKEYSQVVNEATHISESQLDHGCVKNTSLDEFHVTVNAEIIYFSDHYAVRIMLANDKVDFDVGE